MNKPRFAAASPCTHEVFACMQCGITASYYDTSMTALEARLASLSNAAKAHLDARAALDEQALRGVYPFDEEENEALLAALDATAEALRSSLPQETT